MPSLKVEDLFIMLVTVVCTAHRESCYKLVILVGKCYVIISRLG